jgi:glutamate/tyrosine decarboxylase-like PLP-dependent enzyme
LWFSLAAYGTDAYRDAVEKVLAITRTTAAAIAERPNFELIMEPDLSVLLFRRHGWGPDDYDACWRRLLDQQTAFVQPTSWEGEKVMRLCFINPRTTMDHVVPVLDDMD